MNNPIFRIIATLVMVASILWGYWWLTWGLAIVFLFIFPNYYEILFYGIAYDAIYGLPIPQFYNFQYIFSCASIVLFLLSLYLRKYLLAYEPTI